MKDKKQKYVPPKAMRLDGVNSGSGLDTCTLPGSSADLNCTPGNSPGVCITGNGVY
jgi:hypothetical protein